jgi:hypothetical protein
VGPSVQFNAGTQFSGYTGLYPGYGGLLADGYAPDSVSGGIQSPDSGASTKGAIFAPQGSAKLPGGGTALLCPNSIASCGFWEAVSINLPGDNSTYQGEGPPIGGTVSTTTVLSTTTVTLPGTTSPGSTGTTTLQQQIRLRQ